MNLLLDTHIFLWFVSGDHKLANSLRQLISDPANAVFLGVASLWETIIKYQLGKLPLPEPPEIYLPKQRGRHLIDTLRIDEESVAQLAKLPRIHRDPFDRILIAQALHYDMTIVTVDAAIIAYPVRTAPQI